MKTCGRAFIQNLVLQSALSKTEKLDAEWERIIMSHC